MNPAGQSFPCCRLHLFCITVTYCMIAVKMEVVLHCSYRTQAHRSRRSHETPSSNRWARHCGAIQRANPPSHNCPLTTDPSDVVPPCDGPIQLDIPASNIAVESCNVPQHDGPILLDATALTLTDRPDILLHYNGPILLHTTPTTIQPLKHK